MARAPKKRKDFLKQRADKRKHNWSNDCSNRQKMLDMKRQKYFRLELKDILEKTSNQDNKGIIAATLTNKAAKASIDDAIGYVDRLGDSLEPQIIGEIKKLLSRYSTYR